TADPVSGDRSREVHRASRRCRRQAGICSQRSSLHGSPCWLQRRHVALELPRCVLDLSTPGRVGLRVTRRHFAWNVRMYAASALIFSSPSLVNDGISSLPSSPFLPLRICFRTSASGIAFSTLGSVQSLTPAFLPAVV